MKDWIVLLEGATMDTDISGSRINGIRTWQKEVAVGVFTFEEGTFVWGKSLCRLWVDPWRGLGRWTLERVVMVVKGKQELGGKVALQPFCMPKSQMDLVCS